MFSPELGAVLAPAGGTGCLHLFESSNLEQKAICNISSAGRYEGGHGEGTTSADSGAGFVFAIDRTSQSLKVVDPKTEQVVASSKLASVPDYVRWVSSKREVWVTEPDQEQIEVFTVSTDNPPKLERASTIAIQGGPESLVIDAAKGRTFTHLWKGRTAVIDIDMHAAMQTFPNGCQGSRGIALDSAKGFLFVGCSEGKAVVLDVDHGGKELDSEKVPSGVDIVAVNPTLRYFYVPAASDGSVTVFGVGEGGTLTRLGILHGAKGTHCAASDDHNRVWICAPDEGALMVFDYPLPVTTE